MYFRRGIQLLFRRGSHKGGADRPPSSDSGLIEAGRESVGAPLLTLGSSYLAQNFIRKRSTYRWVMHLCLSGGCTLAFAVTFPLVFGWIHFEASPTDSKVYQVLVLGAHVDSFAVGSLKGFLTFNLLNISAFIVLIGLAMAGWRRLTDAGERATQTFFEDILPLLIILAVTVTGLMLTASYSLMGGAGHALLAVVHMLSVLLLLFYIPFGKLFHIFQRSAHFFVRVYKRAGDNGKRAHCKRCNEDFTSAMHVEDLKTVLDQLGFDYRYQNEVHYQDICPGCRRKLLAVNQGASIGR